MGAWVPDLHCRTLSEGVAVRILFLTGKFPPVPCGIGDYTFRLASGLACLGHEPFVITSQREGLSPDENLDSTIRTWRDIPEWNLAGCQSILQRLREHPMEIVHIQYHALSFSLHPAITMLPRLVKSRLRPRPPKIAVTLHELAGPMAALTPGPARRLWLLPLLLSSDSVIVTNERDLSRLSLIPFLRGRLHHIPLASPMSTPTIPSLSREERDSVRQQAGVGPEEILLVRFGFVHNVFGSLIPELLQALRVLVKRGFPARLLLAGGDNEGDRRRILSIASRMGMEDKLLWTGYRTADEISHFLYSSDIAVQLYPDGVSEKRSSLHTVMAHGLPVISTRRGRPSSLFHHGENVLLVSSRHPDQLADAISELIADRPLKKRLSENALRTARRFDWKSIVQATESLYRTLTA